MVSGVGDLTFTGLVFSWFLLTGRLNGSKTGVTIASVQNFGQVIVQAQV